MALERVAQPGQSLDRRFHPGFPSDNGNSFMALRNKEFSGRFSSRMLIRQDAWERIVFGVAIDEDYWNLRLYCCGLRHDRPCCHLGVDQANWVLRQEHLDGFVVDDRIVEPETDQHRPTFPHAHLTCPVDSERNFGTIGKPVHIDRKRAMRGARPPALALLKLVTQFMRRGMHSLLRFVADRNAIRPVQNDRNGRLRTARMTRNVSHRHIGLLAYPLASPRKASLLLLISRVEIQGAITCTDFAGEQLPVSWTGR